MRSMRTTTDNHTRIIIRTTSLIFAMLLLMMMMMKRVVGFHPGCSRHHQWIRSIRKRQQGITTMLGKVPMEGIETNRQAMENFELEILFQDKDLAVVYKPPGMLCVPGKFTRDSLLIRVAKHFRIKDPKAISRMVVHRLDQATSGVIAFALNEASLKKLHEQFRDKSIDNGVGKKYVALVHGVMEEDEGAINLAIRKDMDNPPKQMVDRELGKPSLTEWKVRRRGKDQTLVELVPVTGRTHQLRVHLSCFNSHPILGDVFYAPASVQALSPARLCLHAESLSIRHPTTDEVMTFSKPAPSEWSDI